MRGSPIREEQILGKTEYIWLPVCLWHSYLPCSSSLFLTNRFRRSFDFTEPTDFNLSSWPRSIRVGNFLLRNCNSSSSELDNAFASFCLPPVSSFRRILFINKSLRLVDTPGMTLFGCSCLQKSLTITRSPLSGRNCF